ncbi:hypothetical protein ACFYZJ_37700 [Streptomyces sp. NPDC001848]|uniref:hypothetical protein n=1 Tax=Streptomyces sp. NPDC001848 TaxID=3364618 RepID=UPI0036ACA6E6
MTGPGAGIPRDERPAPVLLHDGVAIPGALCAELASALEEYLTLLPPARRAGRLSRPVAGVLKASRAAAAQWQLQQHQARAAWAAPTPVASVVLGTAQLPSVSKTEEITTTEAADLAGFTAEWWRRLAVRGTIRARQADRNTWLLQRADVIAYTARARQETPHGSNDDGTGPERQAC